MSLEVEDWKVYDACGRHQDLEPMSQYNKSQKGDLKGKTQWNWLMKNIQLIGSINVEKFK